MRILHLVGHSTVQRTPGRIACYWGRYTEHSGECACLRRAGGWQCREPLNPAGIFYAQGKRGKLRGMVDRADVVHCHDDCYPTAVCNPKNKRAVYHAHIGDIPQRFFKRQVFKFNPHVRHAVITNGYGRHFDKHWGRLPDVLDLDHPVYSPLEGYDKRGRPLRVVFTYSNRHERGRKINAKCPKATLALVKGMPGVQLRWVHGKPFEVSMAEKQRAHVVLDEVFSPYTHLASLEGAAVGACVLTSYDDATVAELCDYVGAPRESYPFLRVEPSKLRATIARLRDEPEEAIGRGRAAREWMLRYYHQRALLARYLEFYR